MELVTTGTNQDSQHNDIRPPPHVQIELCDNSNNETYTCEDDKDIEDTNKQDSDSGRCTPQEVEIFREGSPSVRFEEMLIDVINATTMHVDWCPVTNNPDLIGYKIRYTIKDNSSYNEVFVTAGISSYTISGLKPNTEYLVAVCAIDEKENVLQQCGWAAQRTDEIIDGNIPQSSPYIAMVVAAVLLTTAFVVPLTILIVHNYARDKQFDAPTLTDAAAILLLLVAVVVPVTLLVVRTCGQCDEPRDSKNTGSNSGSIHMQNTYNLSVKQLGAWSDADFLGV